jgi:hypothetical protein
MAHAADPRPSIFVIDGKAFAYQEVLVEGKDGRPDTLGPVVVLDVVEAHDHNPHVVADCEKFSKVHKGATWCFATEANLKAFASSIDKDGDSHFEPAFGGYCTVGLSRMNQKVPGGDPRTAILIASVARESGSILVLNGSFDARTRFLADTNGRMLLAETGYITQLRSKVLVPNDKLPSAKK